MEILQLLFQLNVTQYKASKTNKNKIMKAREYGTNVINQLDLFNI